MKLSTLVMTCPVIWIGVAACADDDAPAAEPVPYDARLQTGQVLPDVPFALTIAVADREGVPADDVTLALTAVLGPEERVLGAPVAQGAGLYTVADVALAPEGEWSLQLNMVGPLGTAASTYTLVVGCQADGTEGALCCNSGNCGGDLDCRANVCVAPTCDDGFENGGEEGIDCGGTCSNRCVFALGAGTHDFSRVDIVEIANESDQLRVPRDLAINPDAPEQLWVVNRTETMVVLFDFGTPQQSSKRYGGSFYGSDHFMAQPSALAFGAPNTMATIHETDEYTQGPPPEGTPKDFMGPTLHDTTIPGFDAGHGSHLDMLHHSPNGMGIAWERDNVYWVFDGYNSAITRYDFRDDHGRGGADHSDGVIRRYVTGQVKRLPDVPSHMVFDHASSLLYLADTGNARVAVLDTTSGTVVPGSQLGPYDTYDQRRVDDAVLTTVVDGATIGMQAPSGIALDDDILYVSDNATGRLWAFDKDTGAVLDWLDLGLAPNGLMGLEVGPLGEIYLVDAVANLVARLSPR